MSAVPTLGRIVHDQLTDEDADAINRRRDDYEAFQRGRTPALPGQTGRDGHFAHVGSRVMAGDVFPAMVVRTSGTGHANLQVHVDGNDTYWVTGRIEGGQPGTWHWPPRA
ncbi:hypothetical protein [Nonomuraea sp. NPDC049758]|uniref:hypothetical protein n=1 Tax=Nonomuraea sp. NPDC049758 TaxID=3154360 RepID=UPI0034278C50